MVLGRDSTVEHNATPWRMEMDYENNISLYEANKKKILLLNLIEIVYLIV
jgi:hypothetical protein